MRNNWKVNVKMGSSPVVSASSLYRWYGWCDVAQGLGWRKDYESMTIVQQTNYERGRQQAVIVKSFLGRVPKWPMTHKLSTVLAPIKVLCQGLHEALVEYAEFFGRPKKSS